MIPIYKARGLADGRHQELLAEAERHRLITVLPAGPGTLQRLALRVAGWGRRPAVAPRPVAPRPVALLPWAYRPSAI
jgi:hypothetical protein